MTRVMDNSFATLLLIVFLLKPSSASVGVPVISFQSAADLISLPKVRVGHVISSEELSETLGAIPKLPELAVVFVQDLTYSLGQGSHYWPAVKSPMQALKTLTDKFDEQIELKNTEASLQYITKANLEAKTAIILHLSPTADGESLTKALKTNDEIIGKVMEHIRSTGLSYIAFFTATSHRKHEVVHSGGRHLLSIATPDSSNQTVTVVNYCNATYVNTSLQLLVYFENLAINNQTVTNDSRFDCTLRPPSNGTHFLMTFSYSFGVWEVGYSWADENATLTAKQTNLPIIRAYRNSSYHCNNNITLFWSKTNQTVSNDSLTVTLTRLQMQLFDGDGKMRFDYAYDCAGFFTVPIWTGLCMFFTFLVFVVFGLCMLNNIESFDKYDDARGKPLVVNISE